MENKYKRGYNFLKYSNINRWNSYWYQITETLRLDPETVLEVGIGNDIIGTVLKSEGVCYKSFDINRNLKPDYVGSIKNVNIKDRFDVVLAFQILEHLPYEDFIICLENIRELSNKYAIISLPYYGAYIKLSINKFTFIKKIPFPTKIKIVEHYWSLGRSGYPLTRIREDINKVFKIKKEYLCKRSPFHYFFILEKIELTKDQDLKDEN